MKKIFHVALREFLATVATKGFIIGVLVLPVIVLVMVLVMPLLINEKAPKIEGELAIIDPTGEVVEGVKKYLSPESIAERRGVLVKMAEEKTPAVVKTLADSHPAAPSFDEAMQQALGEVPVIHVVVLQDAQIDREKEVLREEEGGPSHRLALAVIQEDAVREQEGAKEFGSYDLYVRERLDDRIVDEIKRGLKRAIIDARIRQQGLDPDLVSALTRMDRVHATTVTKEGEQQTNEVLNIMIPAGFMILMLVSVMTGSQGLLTTTVEEKSSRVVEVLLSAVSPLELMTGKIIGQMCVGLLMLLIYAGLGLAALVSFAFLGLVDPWLFFYLIIFYLIAYFTLASFMGAIGSAVNELREAQSLMTPVMIILMIPWLLWMPISRDPNSTFATVMSFIPPVNTFVMLIRMASTSPPPIWQVWLSILVGLAGAYLALRLAAKVFRIGLLMYGKPPSFRTLISWIRMA